MQQTTLGCDWCKAGRHGLRPFAVGTFALANGTSNGTRAKAPSLDLCARHARKLERIFAVKRPTMIGRPPGRPVTAKEQAARDERAKRWDARWKEREERVLAALKGSEGLLGPALLKKAKLSKHYVYKVTTRLIAQGKIKRAGAEGERQGFVLA